MQITNKDLFNLKKKKKKKKISSVELCFQLQHCAVSERVLIDRKGVGRKHKKICKLNSTLAEKHQLTFRNSTEFFVKTQIYKSELKSESLMCKEFETRDWEIGGVLACLFSVRQKDLTFWRQTFSVRHWFLSENWVRVFFQDWIDLNLVISQVYSYNIVYTRVVE